MSDGKNYRCEESYDSGYQDGRDEGYDDGYREGHDAGQDEAAREIGILQDEIKTLKEKLAEALNAN
jgi:flagellar biosynthesis/type III secretory pathway protein FliH